MTPWDIYMYEFCETFKHFYSAVIYLRITTSVGFSVRFIGRKTNVALMKLLSILHVELMQ